MKATAMIRSLVAFCIAVFAPSARGDDAGWIRLLDGWRYATIECAQQTSDGGIIVAGSNGVTWRGDLDDAMIAKLDASGSFVWKRIVGGSGSEGFQRVLETDDGGFVAAGVTWSAGYPQGTWLVKFSSSGDVVWNRSLQVAGPPTALLGAPDGGFVMAAGRSFVALDASGKALAVKTYQDQFFYSASLVKTADGGYFAAGYRACAKLDSGGNVEWIREFDTLNSLRDGIETPDGSYLLAGSGYDNGYFGACLKLDASGKLLWKKRYTSDGGCQFSKVAVTGRGTYLLAGLIWTGAYWNTGRPWLVEIDPHGKILTQRHLESGDREGSFGWIGESSDGNLLLSGTIETFGTGVGRDGLLVNLPPSGDLGVCSSLFVDTHAVVASLAVKATSGDPTSLSIETKSKPVKTFIADWEAADNSPCQ